MRILPFLLIVCIIFAGGCARRYHSPALKQFKGHRTDKKLPERICRWPNA